VFKYLNSPATHISVLFIMIDYGTKAATGVDVFSR
jgi:hypothetical protein